MAKATKSTSRKQIVSAPPPLLGTPIHTATFAAPGIDPNIGLGIAWELFSFGPSLAPLNDPQGAPLPRTKITLKERILSNQQPVDDIRAIWAFYDDSLGAPPGDSFDDSAQIPTVSFLVKDLPIMLHQLERAKVLEIFTFKIVLNFMNHPITRFNHTLRFQNTGDNVGLIPVGITALASARKRL